MSDFGTMATVHRTDGVSTSPSDDALIKRVAKRIAGEGSHRVSDFADFNLRFGGSSLLDGSRGAMIGLTEYWASDLVNDDAFDSDAVIRRDRRWLRDLVSCFKTRLGRHSKWKSIAATGSREPGIAAGGAGITAFQQTRQTGTY
jgi:hypothetical protein